MDYEWSYIAEGIRRALGKIAEAENSLAIIVERETKTIQALQSQCPHPAWRHVPDAAGGSDSESVCKLCDYRGD